MYNVEIFKNLQIEIIPMRWKIEVNIVCGVYSSEVVITTER